MNKRLSIEQQTIAQSHTVQSGLAQMLDELAYLMDEQSKLIKLIQAGASQLCSEHKYSSAELEAVSLS